MRPSAARPRLPVALAALAVVLLLAGVTVWAVHDSGAPASQPDRLGPPPSATELDRLARAAPCNLVQDGSHLAGRHEIEAFRARAVVNCRTGERTYPGAGVWQVLTREVAVRGLAQLLEALTRPDARTPPEQACPAIGYLPLTILLVGPGEHYLHPRAPAATCGGPQPATRRAIAALGWRTVSVTKLQQVTSPAALASGCEMAWKNEVALMAGSLSRSAGGDVHVGGTAEPLVACVYRADPSDDGAGEFQRAVRLDGARATKLRAALSLSGTVGTCRPQRAFAVVRARSGAWVNVELGGCWRVVRDDENPARLGRADPAAVTRLLGRA